MDDPKKLTDEQLARYLSGLATSTEESEVLDCLSQSDDAIDDLLHMAEGIELHRREHASKARRIGWHYWSAAAMFVIALGMWLLLHRSFDAIQVDHAPMLAAQDTLDCDSMSVENLPFDAK